MGRDDETLRMNPQERAFEVEAKDVDTLQTRFGPRCSLHKRADKNAFQHRSADYTLKN